MIQKLEVLEFTLRNGDSGENESLRIALAGLEAELLAWRGMSCLGEPSGRESSETASHQADGGALLEAAAANLKQPQGSLDPFDRLARDIEKPVAQHGETNAHRPLSEKQGSPHDGPGTVRAAS
ncbi:MAG TPA: hypothetical protein VL996_12200, partial [Methylocella sp.]|nr:hypothetical protein [Methylocella sp.]